MSEFKEKLNNLQLKLEDLIGKLDLQQKQKEKRELESQSLKPDFWSDPLKAREVTEKIAIIDEEEKKVNKIKTKIEDSHVMLELVGEQNNKVIKEQRNQKYSVGAENFQPDSFQDLQKEIRKIEEDLNQLEINLFLCGKYDRSDCLLSIHAGQGGTEACDWAEMLERMYRRYAERRKWRVEEIDRMKGEETGIKSVELQISGPFAYGYLRKEAGTHRLVRLSPFNANNLRQTSFALVETSPVINEEIAVDIKDDDIQFEAYRASGHGGQNVQKVSTAVRIKHKPTGLIVTCQVERSQAQNRQRAMKLLKSKLVILEEEKLKTRKKELKGEYKAASWGNQIRSYVLHPYKMVKDLRTNYESSQPEKVLDGELEGLINAELKQFD